MRINYRKRKELQDYDGKFKGVQIPDLDSSFFEPLFPKIKELFLDLKEQNLPKRVVSKSILEKVSEPEIAKKVCNEFAKEPPGKDSGIIITNNHTFFYSITGKRFQYLHYHNEYLVSACDDFQGLNYFSEYFKKQAGFNSNIEQEIMVIISIIAFIKYAPIETKILPAKNKEVLFGCKYFNETNGDIQIINSTWFTNLIKSDAFKVRGHFRLQPKKKDGEWTKELIWINDFEKSGYTAPARKLKEDSEL